MKNLHQYEKKGFLYCLKFFRTLYINYIKKQLHKATKKCINITLYLSRNNVFSHSLDYEIILFRKNFS